MKKKKDLKFDKHKKAALKLITMDGKDSENMQINTHYFYSFFGYLIHQFDGKEELKKINKRNLKEYESGD